MERRGEKPSDWPVVITIHGIRTTGDWQREFTDVLTQHGFRHIPLGFGFFKAVSLLMPWSRARKVEWFRRIYSDKFATAERLPSVVAHSFGSYIVTKAMLKYDDIRFEKMILCGSIVSRKYPWSKMLLERGQAKSVLNEAGGRDMWAGIVEWVVPDAGSSGVSGFEDLADGRLTQIIHERHEHSDYFYRQNFEKRWVPFLNGHKVEPVIAIGRNSANWKFRLTATLVIAIGAVLPAIFIGAHFHIDQEKTDGINSRSLSEEPGKELVVIPEPPKDFDQLLQMEPMPVEELPPLPPPEPNLTDSHRNEVVVSPLFNDKLISYLSGIWVNKSIFREASHPVSGGLCEEQKSSITEIRFNDSASAGGKISGRWSKSIKYTSIFRPQEVRAIFLENRECMEAVDTKAMSAEVFGEIAVVIEEPIDWGRMKISADIRGCSTEIDTQACLERFSTERPTGYVQRIDISKFRLGDQVYEKW